MTSHYIIKDMHTGVVQNRKFARRARVQAIVDNKNKKDPGRYVVGYITERTDKDDVLEWANKKFTERVRDKNPKRKRRVNPFKVLIRAVPKRGPKQIFWFDGKHFVKTKTRRAMFSSVSLATVMAKNLIRKYPILKKYDVELWSKVT